MGKRSDFPRVEKDYYRTIDPRAVTALAPHLEPESWFAEPCVGGFDLADSLSDIGHVCAYASDISEGVDALNLSDTDLYGCDLIITNPPWSRPTLHALIDHLSALKPTWLLFDADWAHTLQSKLYMPKCVKIVSVGRLIWIPGTKMQGKDSVCWYLFDANHATSGKGTTFIGR